MSQNISVSFKVAGAELSAYIDNIKQKSDKLTQEAIRAAITQTDKSKEQLKIINDQVAAMEKKSRLETQAARSVLFDKREQALNTNKETFDVRRENVYSDRSLDDATIKERIQAIDGAEKENEQRLKNEYRDNLTILKEQERQQRLQTQISRENLDALKTTARENVKAIMNGDKSLEEVISKAQTDEEKLVARLTEEGVNKEKKVKEKEDGGKEKGAGIFGSLLGVDNINKFISAAGQFTQTQNGFDLIQPASNMAGRIIGGIVGGAIGALAGGVGAVAGAGVGASIGGGFGDVFGALEQREALSKEAFRKSVLKYKAITGSSIDGSGIADLSNVGVDYTTYMGLRSDMARRRGYSAGSDVTTQQSIFAERGLGVDQSTSAAIIELQRSSKSNNRDLAELIGGVLSKGTGIFKDGDTTFLNEFLGKFTSVQKDLLKTQSTVASGTTMDIISRFNRLGGEFDVRDSRSMGNISAIQSALSNPGSDNLKALSFSIMRQQMPNAGIFDLLEERQKGLGSPGYLKGMLGMIDRTGGDDQQKMVQLSGMFPGLSLSAVRRLYNNRGDLMSGNISMDELKNQYPQDFSKLAQDNTTDLEKNQASVNNGILSGSAITAMADAFEKAVRNSMSGAVIELANGQGSIRLMGPKNNVKKSSNSESGPLSFIMPFYNDMFK